MGISIVDYPCRSQDHGNLYGRLHLWKSGSGEPVSTSTLVEVRTLGTSMDVYNCGSQEHENQYGRLHLWKAGSWEPVMSTTLVRIMGTSIVTTLVKVRIMRTSTVDYTCQDQGNQYSRLHLSGSWEPV
ncbi:hypothetical protein RRG08_032719 [Elysia crispata]|uniref:Uncharacterized protein n=1 Tax=Elysia crispata TaxID=231223 RepID=A0AAE0YUR4_9GAST|nr:hypothetical protein RRG08_032719 [Elysia crispata]